MTLTAGDDALEPVGIPDVHLYTFDFHDRDAMEQIITGAARAMSERILYLERELETAHAVHARQNGATQDLLNLADWLINIQDEEALLDHNLLFTSARKARDAWTQNGSSS